jgi:glycosyltransferase involved in cell wall biosynthesis
MHVLVLPSWYPTDADPLAGVFFREQVNALRQAGLDVRVAVPQRYLSSRLYREARKVLPLIERAEEDDVPVYRWSMGVGFGGRFPAALQYRISLLAAEYSFRRYVAEQGMPELIHAHSILWGGVFAAHFKQRFDIPFVVTEHSTAYYDGVVSPFELRLSARVLAGADARTVVSPQLGEQLEAEFGAAARPWSWLPNLVERRFIPADRPRREAVCDRFVFLAIGSLVERKGYPVLLRAFAQAFPEAGDTRLRIAGDGPLRADLERLAAELGIAERVDFLGPCDRDVVLAEIQRADALAHAAPFESFGVIFVEALACGLPIVAASSGGAHAIIHPGNGILTPPDDVASLARGMLELRAKIANYDADVISRECHARFGEAAYVEHVRQLYATVNTASREAN